MKTLRISSACLKEIRGRLFTSVKQFWYSLETLSRFYIFWSIRKTPEAHRLSSHQSCSCWFFSWHSNHVMAVALYCRNFGTRRQLWCWWNGDGDGHYRNNTFSIIIGISFFRAITCNFVAVSSSIIKFMVLPCFGGFCLVCFSIKCASQRISCSSRQHENRAFLYHLYFDYMYDLSYDHHWSRPRYLDLDEAQPNPWHHSQADGTEQKAN